MNVPLLVVAVWVVMCHWIPVHDHDSGDVKSASAAQIPSSGPTPPVGVEGPEGSVGAAGVRKSVLCW
jgi:hypothetical protein